MEEKIPSQNDDPVDIPHQHHKKVNWFLLLAYVLIILWSIYYFMVYSK